MNIEGLRNSLEDVASSAPIAPAPDLARFRRDSERRHRRELVAISTSMAVVGLGVMSFFMTAQQNSTPEPAQIVGAVSSPAASLAHPIASTSPTQTCLHGGPSGAVSSNAAIDDRIASVLGSPDSKTPDGVPTRLLSGILGSVTTESGSVVVVADASKVDLGVLKSRVTSGLSASDASLVSVEPSCTSSDALVSAWRRVFARDWAANAPKLAFGMFLDARTEKIVVETDATAAGPSTISSLEAVAPGLITITDGTAQRY